jgi:hypothetical protein
MTLTMMRQDGSIDIVPMARDSEAMMLPRELRRRGGSLSRSAGAAGAA